jgi:hypothetical protein
MKYQRISLILRCLTPLFCFAGILLLQNIYLNKITSKDKTEVDYTQEEQSIKVVLDLQKNLPSFGFDNLIANWNFLNFIQYYGDTEARDKIGYSLTPNFFETIVDRDPRFVQASLILSTANSIYAARPDKTITFMNRVVQSISPETSPISPYVWIYKGVDEILYLGDIKAAQNSYDMASQWFGIQGNEYMSVQTRETANFLATNPDAKKAQIGAWATILSTNLDKKTQQYALDKIRSLGADVFISPEGKLQIRMPETK